MREMKIWLIGKKAPLEAKGAQLFEVPDETFWSNDTQDVFLRLDQAS